MLNRGDRVTIKDLRYPTNDGDSGIIIKIVENMVTLDTDYSIVVNKEET